MEDTMLNRILADPNYQLLRSRRLRFLSLIHI